MEMLFVDVTKYFIRLSVSLRLYLSLPGKAANGCSWHSCV